jgi:hypothetical protein
MRRLGFVYWGMGRGKPVGLYGPDQEQVGQ